MTSPEVASLARELAEMQRQLRDLAIGNPLNSAEVVDASGNAVQLSQLAFGQVVATKAGVGAISLTGPASAPPGNTGWLIGDPEVTALVTGGKLRVDVAALLAVAGGTNSYMAYSYEVRRTGPVDAPNTEDVQVVAPDYYRGLVVRDSSVVAAYGTWAFHTGLSPGWYRVRAAFRLSYGTTASPAGSADNPRIAATPF